jgi:hypothetical protein
LFDAQRLIARDAIVQDCSHQAGLVLKVILDDVVVALAGGFGDFTPRDAVDAELAEKLFRSVDR